jgi:exopolysaccharide biosynthesis WecB/TagA/CpsF family protein
MTHPLRVMAPPAAVPTTPYLGLDFAHTSPQAMVRRLRQPWPRFGYVVTPNASHMVKLRRNAQLQAIYRRADAVLCDSQILRALAYTAGRDLPLVTGSDLVADLMTAENADPARDILIVGGHARDMAALRARYPRARLRHLDAPHGLARDPRLRRMLVERLLHDPFDIVLLCVGCPAQELLAEELAERRDRSGVALCVGASIEFLIGKQTRAPHWMRRHGLEWAWRLASDPKRLWHRYLVESPQVVALHLRWRLSQEGREP